MSEENFDLFKKDLKSQIDSLRSWILDDLDSILEGMERLLIEKNRSYGDSSLDPMRIFYRGSMTPEDLIDSRLDEKLSRVIRGDTDVFREDDVRDITGYLILKMIARKRVNEGG